MGSATMQGQLWGAAARDWASIVEPGQTPFYEAAFDAINVREGMSLLDVGCSPTRSSPWRKPMARCDWTTSSRS